MAEELHKHFPFPRVMATQNTENSNTPKPFGLLSFAQVLAYFKMWKGRNRKGTLVNAATLKTEGLELPELATAQTITVQTLSLPIIIQMLPSIKTITKFSNLCQKPQTTVLIYTTLYADQLPSLLPMFCSSPSLLFLAVFVFLTYNTHWLSWLNYGTSPE